MYNYSIVADPTLVQDPARTARTLGPALDVPPARIEKLLRLKRREVYLEKKITPLLDRRVDISSLPGIMERLELKRVYPQGELAAPVVGFIDDAGVGKAGIESEFESILRGTPGWATELRDGRGRSYQALGRRTKPAVSGHDVVLTLDATLQDVAASELRRQVEELDARAGVFVAVDPRTGEILAMVSYPFYDPQRVKGASENALRNRAVMSPYEPGSTFKLVAAATALSDHLLEAGTPVNCENGSYNFGRFRITDHHPYGIEPFRRCFAVSSNIAFAKVGELCDKRLYDFARAFGFGAPTGVGLPGEDAGVLHRPEDWSGRSAATVAIGYEVMVTPLQLAMAYAAVANDGVLMRPLLVRAISDPEGKVVYQGRPEEVRRVVTPEVARTLRGFMREVMTDGTGKDIDIPWVEVGGKTGTSEKLVDGRYTSGKHYASFVGMAPIDDPKIVCLVMIDEPHRSTFGSSAAAPVFREVLEAWGRLPGAVLSPDYARVEVSDRGGESLADLAATPVIAGGHDRAPLPPSPEQGMPELGKMSLRQALLVLRAYGVDAEVSGSGVVTAQYPPAGAPLPEKARITCGRAGTGTLVAAPDRPAVLQPAASHGGRKPAELN